MRSTRARARRAIAAVVVASPVLAAAVMLAASPPATAGNIVITTPDGTPSWTGSLEVQGTSDPGDSILLTSPSSEDCATTADGMGGWSCEVVFTDSGEVTLTAEVTASSGSVGDTDTVMIPVSRPPVLNFWEDDVVYGSQYPEFSGEADIDGVVSVYVEGSWFCEDHMEYYEFYFSCDAEWLGGEGDFTGYVQYQHDLVGFNSDPVPFTLRVDLTAEQPEYTLPVVAPDTPFATTTTSRTSPAIGGTAEPYSHITVYTAPSTLGAEAHPEPTDIYCEAWSDEDGEWYCELGEWYIEDGPTMNVDLTPGYYVFGATVEDWLDNTSSGPQADLGMQVLAGPPTPGITAPAAGASLSSRDVTFRGTGVWGDTVTVREGSKALCSAQVRYGQWQCTEKNMAYGSHTVTARASNGDTASSAATRSFTIPAPPSPEEPEEYDFECAVLGADGSVTVDAVEPGETISVACDGLPPGSDLTVELHSTPVVLGSTTAGPDGSAALSAVIPPDTPPGPHSVVVSLDAPGYAPSTASQPVVVAAAAAPEPTPAPSPSTGPGTDATGGEEEPAAPAADGPRTLSAPSTIGSSLPSLSAAPFTLEAAASIGAIAAAFLVLVAFPAELLKSVLSENYARLFRRRGVRAVRQADEPRTSWWANLATIVGTAVILGFADPGFGFNGTSVRLVLALVLSLLLVNLLVAAAVRVFAHRRLGLLGALDPMPWTLALVALAVIATRLLEFQPGFLFGAVIGVAFARQLHLAQEARLSLVAVSAMVVTGLGCWIGYSALAGDSEGFWVNLARDGLAAGTAEALSTLVLTLLPFDFLEGQRIFRWSKAAWVAIYLVAVAVFVFVVLPEAGEWNNTSGSLGSWLVPFAVFAAISVGAWAVFRWLGRRERSASRPG